MPDNDPLMPRPTVLKVKAKEIRIAPLSNRELLNAVKYVRDNYEILEKFSNVGKPAEEGGVEFDEVIEKEVLPKVNTLVRMVSTGTKDLDDEWFITNLGPAHYRAIGTAFLKQNEAYDLFVWAKGLLGANMAQALRQAVGTMSLAPKKANPELQTTT